MDFQENRRYEYFLKTAEIHNVTKAAEQLFISQPALSKYIAQLERDIGTPLFIRKKEWELTEAGNLFKDYILSSYKLQQDFNEGIAKLIHKDIEDLRLGITPWRVTFILPNLLAQTATLYPYINLTITEESSPNLASLLQKGKLDIYIATYSKELDFQNQPYLQHEILYHDILLAITSKKFVPKSILYKANNKAEHLTSKEFANFRGLRLINSKPGKTLYARTLLIVKKYALIPSSMIETANIDNAIQLAKSGYGITFIPRSYLRNQDSLDPDLCCFEIKDELFDWYHCAFYYENSNTTLHKKVINIIKAMYRN